MKKKIISNGTIVRFHAAGYNHYGIIRSVRTGPGYHPEHYDILCVDGRKWVISGHSIQTLQSILKDRKRKPWDYQYDCDCCPGNVTLDDGWHKFGCSRNGVYRTRIKLLVNKDLCKFVRN